MKIEKNYTFTDEFNRNRHLHALNIYIFDDENTQKAVFIHPDKFNDGYTEYIDFNNLCNQEFLDEHKVEYIIDKNDENAICNIIPIGLVDFYNKNTHYYNSLNLISMDKKQLHKVNAIIKNIVKAIQIKYEAYKFVSDCNEKKVEIIELD